MSSLAAALEHPRDHRSASTLHHLAVERDVAAHTDGWAIVRPGTFANNLLSWAYLIQADQYHQHQVVCGCGRRPRSRSI